MLLLPNEVTEMSDLKSIRKFLPQDTEVIEYYIAEGVSDQVFRLVFDRSSIVISVLPITAAQLSSGVQALLHEVCEPEEFREVNFKSHAAAMAKSLLPPSWLASFESIRIKHLFVVPTGALYMFPFTLLVDNRGHYLAENSKLDLAYLPNAAALKRPAPRLVEASRSRGFVNPALDEDHHEALSAAQSERTRLSDAFRRWSGGELSWEFPLTGGQFLALAKTTDNVFLYSHGRYLPNDPTGSYIRFADENGENSYVSVADLLGVRTGHGLWVIAACSSGAGKLRSGDEVLGLPRALLEAGASMVVISLWDVDATSSLDLMARFYKQLANGVRVAEALRSASSELRQTGRPPYDWAPFILIGQHGFSE